jgi:hypothetical protein
MESMNVCLDPLSLVDYSLTSALLTRTLDPELPCAKVRCLPFRQHLIENLSPLSCHVSHVNSLGAGRPSRAWIQRL